MKKLLIVLGCLMPLQIYPFCFGDIDKDNAKKLHDREKVVNAEKAVFLKFISDMAHGNIDGTISSVTALYVKSLVLAPDHNLNDKNPWKRNLKMQVTPEFYAHTEQFKNTSVFMPQYNREVGDLLGQDFQPSEISAAIFNGPLPLTLSQVDQFLKIVHGIRTGVIRCEKNIISLRYLDEDFPSVKHVGCQAISDQIKCQGWLAQIHTSEDETLGDE